MAMNLRNLDARTRELMMNELEYDLEHDTLRWNYPGQGSGYSSGYAG